MEYQQLSFGAGKMLSFVAHSAAIGFKMELRKDAMRRAPRIGLE
jgi:hypothetical protein